MFYIFGQSGYHKTDNKIYDITLSQLEPNPRELTLRFFFLVAKVLVAKVLVANSSQSFRRCFEVSLRTAFVVRTRYAALKDIRRNFTPPLHSRKRGRPVTFILTFVCLFSTGRGEHDGGQMERRV
jgi:hypothetical protein